MRLTQFSYLSITTHLLAIVLGAGCCFWLGSSSDDDTSSGKLRTDRRATHTSLPSAHDEINRMIADEIKDRDTSYVYNRVEQNKEYQEELDRLLVLAQQYRHVTDLHSSITEALIADDVDAAQAIFLEWYWRNPDAAFDALALRGNWIESLDLPLVQHLTSQHLIAQINHPSRTENFKGSITFLLSDQLASNDDLHGLIDSYKQLDESGEKDLTSYFLMGWVPEDAQETARIISHEMPENMRHIFLNHFDNTSNPFASYTPILSKDLAEALLAEDIEISEEVRTALIQASHREEPSGEPYIPSTDNENVSLDAGLDSHQSIRALSAILDRQLFHDRDYPELFARGEVSIEEITRRMQEKIEDSQYYPEEFNRVIFKMLARHSPEKSLTWARSHLTPEALIEDSQSVLISDYYGRKHEPRLIKNVELIALFDPAFLPSDRAESISQSYITQLDQWAQFAPEFAERALQQLPATLPIWQYRPQPEEESSP